MDLSFCVHTFISMKHGGGGQFPFLERESPTKYYTYFSSHNLYAKTIVSHLFAITNRSNSHAKRIKCEMKTVNLKTIIQME